MKETMVVERSPELSPELMATLAARLKAKTGAELFSYKPRLLHRRLRSRLRARKCQGLAEYLALIEEEPGEWKELVKALSIHVSGFFRNPETFWFLRDQVFPQLLRRRSGKGDELLVVSAGCAEGEEPYSLALLLLHYFPRELERRRVRIVGLDVEGEVLARAERAVYGEERLEDLPAELRDRYFARVGKGFQLAEEVRKRVEFRVHDLRQGMPWRGISLLSCRNVLIYYRREHQLKILKGFHESLAEGGYLVLGKTEMLWGQLGQGFTTVDAPQHIYRKAGDETCGWR